MVLVLHVHFCGVQVSPYYLLRLWDPKAITIQISRLRSWWFYSMGLPCYDSSFELRT